MVTYWIEPTGAEGSVPLTRSAEHQQKLIKWNVDTLEKLVQEVIHYNATSTPPGDIPEAALPSDNGVGCVMDRAKAILPFDTDVQTKSTGEKESSSLAVIPLDATIKTQLTDMVTAIAHMYPDHAFHNFEHASHVTLSALNLLAQLPESNPLSQDPMARLAIVFACLVHDVDHPGVSNAQSVAENSDLARLYKGRCVAEQNSIALAWGLLQDDSFQDLRRSICPTPARQHRFQQLFIKAVLSTDISDRDLNTLRKESWDQAFPAETTDDSLPKQPSNGEESQNQKSQLHHQTNPPGERVSSRSLFVPHCEPGCTRHTSDGSISGKPSIAA